MERSNSLIVLSGSFCVGKTTLLEGIRKKYGEKFNYITDGGRIALENHETHVDDMSRDERVDVQMDVFEHYMYQEGLAHKDERVTLMDGSLIEVCSYNKDVLTRPLQKTIENIMATNAKRYVVLKLPLSGVAMEADGTRHNGVDYRAIIDCRIDEYIKLFCVRRHLLPKRLSATTAVRMEAVEALLYRCEQGTL